MRKKMCVCLVFLVAIGFSTVGYPERKRATCFLQVMYYWKLLPNCGTLDVNSCRVPFHVSGNKIVGEYEVGKDEIPPKDLVPHPIGPLQHIDFSFVCGACKVSGMLFINKVWGRVEKVGAKKMLHFYIQRTRSVCKVDCPGTQQDFDCSVQEPVLDEFVMPFKDGAILTRGTQVVLKYALFLK